MASGGVGGESPTLPQNWEKGDCIGQGTFGEVYHVSDKDSPWKKRFIVKEMKCYSNPYWQRETKVGQAKSQLERLKSIQHYSLVSIVDVCTEGNVLSLFSPFMPEGTLADYIRRKGPIPESLASTFTHQLLEGVSYLHSIGIVHQNIKCSNLLLTLGFYVKLADYDVSDTLESLCHQKTVMVGSFNWMAPEVLCGGGQEQKHTSADIWSVGCTVIEMITGKPPFPDLKMNQVIRKYSLQESCEYTLPQGSSDALNKFIGLVLQKESQLRPNASSLMEHDFPQGRLNPVPKKWEKGSRIGHGTFSKIYLVRDPKRPDDKFFVAKEMGNMTENEKKMVSCETAILKRVKHDRIVSFLGILKKENTVSIILTYMPMGSLNNYIKDNGSFSELKALKLLQQIVEGVSYLHSRNILHRDINGANILLVTERMVKLADFGISKLLDKFFGTNTENIGTLSWMAPEVICAEHYGLSADLWSTGCVFVEMLTGKKPYHGMERLHIMLQLSKGVRPQCQTQKPLSPTTTRILDSVFEINPANRPTADSLLETLLLESNPANLPAADRLQETRSKVLESNPANHPAADRLQETRSKVLESNPANRPAADRLQETRSEYGDL